MGAGYYPQQHFLAAESKALAHADFTENDREMGDDQYAHAAGKVCASCEQPITARQPARRRGESDWVHDVCPSVPAPDL